jgi:hypothetical protein
MLESLHQRKTWHMIVTFLFSLSVWSSCLAFGVVDKIEPPDPGNAPFTHYHWWTLAFPTLGIFVFGLMLHTWANNMIRGTRTLLMIVGIIYAILLGALFIFLIFERQVLCPSGPPWKPWCTDGGASPIDFEYDWYFWSVLIQLILLIAELMIFNMISTRVRALLHPMTGMTHEQIVRELYSSHGPRYVQSIGTSVADVVGKFD